MPSGERLKEERERLGLSQQSLADLCSVTMRSQRNYEKNDRQPDSDYFAKAAAAGVDIMYVITGKKANKKTTKIVNVYEFESDSKVAEKGAPYGLAPREEALLDNYRHSGEEGKRAVEAAARAVAESAAQGKLANGKPKK